MLYKFPSSPNKEDAMRFGRRRVIRDFVLGGQDEECQLVPLHQPGPSPIQLQLDGDYRDKAVELIMLVNCGYVIGDVDFTEDRTIIELHPAGVYFVAEGRTLRVRRERTRWWQFWRPRREAEAVKNAT